MKKLTLIAAAFAMVLSSCSNADKNDIDNNPETIRFEITTVNNLKGTKANLYSEEPIHSVSNVNVYVFAKTGSDYLYQKTYTMPNWTQGLSYGRYDVPANDMLLQNDYKFIAVGRDASDNFTLPTLDASTNFDYFTASVANAGMETEIFAGTKNLIIDSDGMRVAISISRQVAGVLGYLENIPADIGGTPVRYMRLTVTNSNKSVNLTSGVGSDLTNSSYNIFDVDFNGRGITSEGTFEGNVIANVTKLDNSQLNGAFVIPVDGVSMTLGLYDASFNQLKAWPVRDENSNSTFNITANHLYALGKKVSSTTTTGTPENPTPDTPIDLLKDQSITVTILPNWTLIHDMNLQ